MKLRLLVPIAALLVCALVVSSSPAGASSESGRTTSQTQKSLRTTALKLDASSIAQLLLEKAAGVAANRGVGFVFTTLGLNTLFPANPDSKTLEDITTQLTTISNQLTNIETALGILITDERDKALQDKLKDLNRYTNAVQTLFDGPFSRVVDAADDLEKAESRCQKDAKSPDCNNITTLEGAVRTARDQFITAYDRDVGDVMVKNIHDLLVPPNPLTTSIMAAYGHLKLATERYLTSADSVDIRNLYKDGADSEALAAWMKMERNIPALGSKLDPSTTFLGSEKAYNDARHQFLNFRVAEAVHLAPTIPPDVVVDAGPPPGTNTNDKMMWLPAQGVSRFRPGVDGAGTVSRARDDLNAGYAGTFTDWQIPSQAAVTAFLGGFTSKDKTPGSFLSGLNPTSPAWQQIGDKTLWPFVWSNDLVNQSVRCIPGQRNGSGLGTTVVVQTHTGVSTSTSSPVWSGRPQLSSIVSGSATSSQSAQQVCDEYIGGSFAGPGAAGGFLASRSTGTMPIDYVSFGTGANLRPGANLRSADLTNFDITGLDLSGADLTGAKLKGALFSDDQGATGVNLTGAQLFGVTSGGILGNGTLPAPWLLTHGYLVGPGAHLTGANLAANPEADPALPPADLSGATLTGVVSGGVDCTGCTLPTGWRWTGQLSGGYLVGPGANLAGADLSSLDLSGMNLADADLTGAFLSGANLSGANLSGVKLDGANLSGANLTGATFTGAKLSGADLTAADLTNAVIRTSDLSGANLSGGNLTNADVGQTILDGANFTGATLTGLRTFTLSHDPAPLLPAGWIARYGYLLGPTANLHDLSFVNEDLTGANLAGANLAGANLFLTNLTGVNLTGADLTGANLSNALLTNATLVNATLTNANVTSATFSSDSDAKFAGIVSGGLVGTPKALPANGHYRVVQGHLVGPNTNLAGATFTSAAQLGAFLNATNFTNATLSGVSLKGLNLANAILSGARLTGADISLADMSNATLDGVISGGLTAFTPTLPAGWRVVNGYLVGPGANLAGANLSDSNLTGVNLGAASLSAANLTDVNFTGANLEGAELAGAVVTGATWSSTICADGVQRSIPCGPVAWLGTSTVTASRDNSDGTLLVDVGPDLGGATWRVTIQKLSQSGGWVADSVQTTKGPDDTLKLNLPSGTYRGVVPPQHSYHGSASGPVVLAK